MYAWCPCAEPFAMARVCVAVVAHRLTTAQSCPCAARRARAKRQCQSNTTALPVDVKPCDMSVRDVRPWSAARQMCVALEVMHAAPGGPVAHRDVKPGVGGGRRGKGVKGRGAGRRPPMPHQYPPPFRQYHWLPQEDSRHRLTQELWI